MITFDGKCFPSTGDVCWQKVFSWSLKKLLWSRAIIILVTIKCIHVARRRGGGDIQQRAFSFKEVTFLMLRILGIFSIDWTKCLTIGVSRLGYYNYEYQEWNAWHMCICPPKSSKWNIEIFSNCGHLISILKFWFVNDLFEILEIPPTHINFKELAFEITENQFWPGSGSVIEIWHSPLNFWLPCPIRSTGKSIWNF